MKAGSNSPEKLLFPSTGGITVSGYTLSAPLHRITRRIEGLEKLSSILHKIIFYGWLVVKCFV